MYMPLDALNTLYKIAIDREAAERKRREEEEKRKKEQEKAEKRRQQYVQRRGNQPMGMNTDPSFYVSQPEAEAFEDELLEEGFG